MFQAIRHYSKALMALQFLIKDGIVKEQEPIQKLIEDIEVPCNLNLSLCYLNSKHY